MTVSGLIIDALREIAASQLDVISRRQALPVGLTTSQWETNACGLLTPVLPGTAAILAAGQEVTDLQRCQAAILTSRTPVVLCLGSSLRAHEVMGTPQGDSEHVSLGARTMHQRSGLLERHWFTLPEEDRTTIHGLPATTVFRSLLDVAPVYDVDHLLAVTDSALHLKLLDPAALARLISCAPDDKHLILRFADGRRESPLESRAALRMAHGGLRPEPQVTLQLPGFGPARPDFLFDGVVVECDGKGPHDDLPTRYADRLRHEALERAGFIVVRVVWADVVHNWPATLKRIKDALYDAETRRRAGLRINAERVGLRVAS